MYFSKFPILSYPSNIGDEKKYVLARNIIRRVSFSEDVKNSVGAFIEYHIKDGERPEHISDRVYGNSEEHWIILLANDIIDPYHDWYKSDTVLQDYISKKYNTYSIFFTDQTNSYLYNTNLYAGCTLSQNAVSSSILEYHPTLSKIVTYSPFYVGGATLGLSGGTNVSVNIKRVLSSNTAVHHFEQQSPSTDTIAQDFITVDPFSKQTNQYNSYTNLHVFGKKPPETGIRQSTTLSGSELGFWETYIGKYMGISGDAVDTYAVSNFIYEQRLNESRRKIKVLHPRYLDTVKRELEGLLRV